MRNLCFAALLFFEGNKSIILNLDWSNLNGHGCSALNYCVASKNAECVGQDKVLAEAIHNITARYGIARDDITFIGFSLGSHLAGSLAHRVYMTDRKLGLIGAIDGKDRFSDWQSCQSY